MGADAGRGVDDQAALGDLLLLATLTEGHRESEYRVDAGGGAAERLGVGEVAGGELHTTCRERLGGGRLGRADVRDDLVAVVEEQVADRSSLVAGGTDDENLGHGCVSPYVDGTGQGGGVRAAAVQAGQGVSDSSRARRGNRKARTKESARSPITTVRPRRIPSVKASREACAEAA